MIVASVCATLRQDHAAFNHKGQDQAALNHLDGFYHPLHYLERLAFGAELVSSPASPTLLDSHRSGRSSLDSLKRAREVLEMPLALRLDVLAGPAQNKSYTTDPGVTQVCHIPS